jgi:hypothetical protein
VPQKINPSELAIIVNKTHIKTIFANRSLCWPPHTSENTSSRGLFDTLVDFG